MQPAILLHLQFFPFYDKGVTIMKKILVLEDESNIRSFVAINLRRSGFEPIEAGTGEEALEKLKVNPDICLALLDVMLPDIDGFEVCRRIRASGSKMGIIMLTAKSQEMDKITGLMTGADDYQHEDHIRGAVHHHHPLPSRLYREVEAGQRPSR